MDERERVNEIDRECLSLRKRLSELLTERSRLSLQIRRAEHPCPCVKLNDDIGVHDMVQQDARRRNPLGLGFVRDCLSADKDCRLCFGTGKPNHHVN